MTDGGIDENNLQFALDTFQYTCTNTRIQYYIQCRRRVRARRLLREITRELHDYSENLLV